MNRALIAAAAGMSSAQRDLETVASNLASADVAGFKGRAERGTRTLFTQGKLEHSNGAFDVAIEGEGFFAVSDGTGRTAFTRDGEFSRAKDGTLRTVDGWRLAGVRIPADALAVSVGADGRVTARMTHASALCGRIRLAEFTAPEALRSEDGTRFFATHESGRARFADPGSDAGPQIRFGMLERANVTIIEGMLQLLNAQRAYEANAKGVQAADEVERIANNLSRD